MTRVDVVPVGDVPEEVLRAIETCIEEHLGLVPARRPAIPVPAGAFDPKRRQHSSPEILREIHARRSKGAFRVLAVTESDLFIPMLSFVFGQAQLDGEAALVSLARLRQEAYGLPASPRLLLERAVKEALHELGHTFGITHCEDGSCAMSLSSTVHQIDLKRGAFCSGCALLLEEARRRAGMEVPAGSEADP